MDDLIHYGCGMMAPLTWRNFDASPTLRFERIPVLGRLYTKNPQRFPYNIEYGDIVIGLPIDDESARLVYCSHVLEHLSLQDARSALVNTFRILADGGVFRCVLPDLEQLVEHYSSSQTAGAAHRFLSESGLGRVSRPRGVWHRVADSLSGAHHQWLYDFKSLEMEMAAAGFRDIRRAYYGDSAYPEFMEVEDEKRWEECLGMECRK